MGQLTVVYDACVLYPAPLRSLLMYLAMTGLYRARWTHDIHEEWMRNVVRDYPDITRAKVEKIRDLMNAHVLDGVVTGYESHIPSLVLPDPDDCHVLAAAIQCEADIIVTFNTKHFPDDALRSHGVAAQHPDDFIKQQLDIAPETVCEAARQQRASLKNPPHSVEQYLRSLERQQLPQVVIALRQFSESI